jgi:bisphosphoglycerate-dependent phosphoglycerate mutase
MSRSFLVGHGQSVRNLQNRFTGRVDVPPSPKAVIEAQQAAVLSAGEHVDVAFISTPVRAQDSLDEILIRNPHCAQYVCV